MIFIFLKREKCHIVFLSFLKKKYRAKLARSTPGQDLQSPDNIVVRPLKW